MNGLCADGGCGARVPERPDAQCGKCYRFYCRPHLYWRSVGMRCRRCVRISRKQWDDDLLFGLTIKAFDAGLNDLFSGVDEPCVVCGFLCQSGRWYARLIDGKFEYHCTSHSEFDVLQAVMFQYGQDFLPGMPMPVSALIGRERLTG